MPLRDHFHTPWSDENHWEGFHSAWANTIVRHLNASLLPPQFRAIPQVHLGTWVEVDVAAFERNGDRLQDTASSSGPVATLPYTPPKPIQTVEIEFPEQDLFEVRILDESRGMRLVGAVELVSPGNKDRPETRRAFVSKCATYLRKQVGLLMVDVVTSRHANFHAELLELLLAEPSASPPGDLYAAAYRPLPGPGKWHLETWPETLALGSPLPSLPLWLGGELAVPLDLEASYSETCRVLRIKLD